MNKINALSPYSKVIVQNQLTNYLGYIWVKESSIIACIFLQSNEIVR